MRNATVNGFYASAATIDRVLAGVRLRIDMRRLVGYGRLSGPVATQTLAQLDASSRLYINFFQPSFKLKSKTHDGARVHKVYHD